MTTKVIFYGLVFFAIIGVLSTAIFIYEQTRPETRKELLLDEIGKVIDEYSRDHLLINSEETLYNQKIFEATYEGEVHKLCFTLDYLGGYLIE